MTSEWHFADVWETVARTVPTRRAQIHGERASDWQAFDGRADGVAARLLDFGLKRHDKVALYLYNTPEYLETAFAVMKAALVPVNTNYRYKHDALRARCPGVKAWLHVGRGRYPCPAWAASYEEAAESSVGRTNPPWGRSGDDHSFAL